MAQSFVLNVMSGKDEVKGSALSKDYSRGGI